jgi:hypothetical protein
MSVMMEMMLIKVDLASSSMVIRMVVVSSMYSVTVTRGMDTALDAIFWELCIIPGTSYMVVSILFRVRPSEGPRLPSPAADACGAPAGVFPEEGW